MTDSERLLNDIQDKGLKRKFIAEKLGISQYQLSKKINNIVEFKASEIKLICGILGYKNEEMISIFFASAVE